MAISSSTASLTAVDPHVALLLGMTFICPVIARALARGNAAIKPRAESSSLELCRGGAGSTEGQSSFALCHPECNEGSPTRLPFLTPPLVGFEEILHFVQNDILATIVRCLVTAVDPHVAPLLGMTLKNLRFQRHIIHTNIRIILLIIKFLSNYFYSFFKLFSHLFFGRFQPFWRPLGSLLWH